MENSDTPKRQVGLKSMRPIKINHDSNHIVEASNRYEKIELKQHTELETLGSTGSKIGVEIRLMGKG